LRKQTWLITIAILITGTCAYLYILSQSSGVAVQAVRVELAEMIQYEQATGKVRPVQEQKVFAGASGKVLKVYVKAGDAVTENQILAELDPSDTELRLRQLEAQMEQLQADWSKSNEGPRPEERSLQQENVNQAGLKAAEAARGLDKARNDYDAGIITAEQLRQKENEVKLAQSVVESAKQQLALLEQGPSAADHTKYQAQLKELSAQQELLQKDLTGMKVVSGSGGTVMAVQIREGQLVERGMELLEVANLTRLEVLAEVKETLIPKVKLNQQALIKGSALGGETLHARVVSLAPNAKPSATSTDKKPIVEVTLAFDQDKAGKASPVVLPGYQVDVHFEISKTGAALTIPRNAVQQLDDGSSYVWTVQEDRAIRQPIQLGLRNEVSAEVKQGLETGQTVIVKPPDSLTEQQKVKVESMGK
jgi:HlyD family secretion protein